MKQKRSVVEPRFVSVRTFSRSCQRLSKPGVQGSVTRGCEFSVIQYVVDWKIVLLEDWGIGLVRCSGAWDLNAVSHKGSADSFKNIIVAHGVSTRHWPQFADVLKMSCTRNRIELWPWSDKPQQPHPRLQ